MDLKVIYLKPKQTNNLIRADDKDNYSLKQTEL